MSRSLPLTPSIALPSSLRSKRILVHTVRSGRVSPASVRGPALFTPGQIRAVSRQVTTLPRVSAVHDLLATFFSHLSVEIVQLEADIALLREEPANLGADQASEATNLLVAIRRAEPVDDRALPTNDATWIENSRSGIMHIAWICGIGAPAITWRTLWRFLVSSVLHLAYSETKCLDVFQPLHRGIACFGERGGVSGNSAATRRGMRHKWQCHSCPWHNWHDQLTPSPSLRNPPTFYSRVSCAKCSNAMSARESKEKSCVVLPHAAHIHSVTLDAHPPVLVPR